MAEESRMRRGNFAWAVRQPAARDTHDASDARHRARYSRQVAGILAAATTLSMIHSVHTALTLDPAYGREPALYILYAVLWGLVALARTDRRAGWWAITVTLALLIAIGIFYYPTIFVPAWQTPFGWFENDVYMGLLILAAYLAVQRLRGVTIAPEA